MAELVRASPQRKTNLQSTLKSLSTAGAGSCCANCRVCARVAAKENQNLLRMIVVVVVVLLSWSAGAGLSLGRELQSLIDAMSPARKWWSAGGALVAGAAMRARCLRAQENQNPPRRVLFDGFQSLAIRGHISDTVIGGAMVKSADLGQKEERKGGRIQRDAQSRRTRPDPQQPGPRDPLGWWWSKTELYTTTPIQPKGSIINQQLIWPLPASRCIIITLYR
ncbi:uncharacterized protein BDR25DRAFT_363805 [Lindgomyces ingoldianus]|uniref:Uncharacterized protein n=1 Tax=Lindgomyces ingoldianus TaxID=673940 RepID=A0ACB6Q711_9PLEO|nr:uncharacterized protein BDR25DRAFT_363805 [Lindgomyces ingoldianus]KAF2462619.1 hypothetical protein BDR25DRAFT_363805 [Lindgomyces ingoldianus]